jgi:hypothetical protein
MNIMRAVYLGVMTVLGESNDSVIEKCASTISSSPTAWPLWLSGDPEQQFKSGSHQQRPREI